MSKCQRKWRAWYKSFCVANTNLGSCDEAQAEYFSKSDRQSTARSGGRAPQSSKYLNRSQAPRKGEFRRRRKRKNTQVGVFPYISKCNYNRLPLSFDSTRRKRKLTKKTPSRVSPVATGEVGFAPPPQELLKKLDQNLCLLSSRRELEQNLPPPVGSPVVKQNSLATFF